MANGSPLRCCECGLGQATHRVSIPTPHGYARTTVRLICEQCSHKHVEDGHKVWRSQV